MIGGASSYLRASRGVIGITAAVAGVLLLAGKCARDQWSKERDKLIAVSDSLRIVTREDSALAAALVAAVNREAALRAAAEDRARRAIADADRLRALRRTVQPVASNPALPPTVSDSLVAADSALVLCVEETMVLRAALDTNRAIIRSAERQIGHLEAALSLEVAAAASLRPVVANLTTQLAAADPPCRVLWMKCPSRTTVFVSGAILGLGITYAMTRP